MMSLPPFNIAIGVVVITVALLIFWLPLRKTRKAKGQPIPAGAGVPKKGRVLVYFSSPYCHNCREVSDLVDGIIEQGKPVVKIDVAESPDLAAALGIRVVPTIAVVEDGVVLEILAGNAARRVDSLVV